MKNILKFNKFQNKMPSHKKKGTPRKATHREEFITSESNISTLQHDPMLEGRNEYSND